MVRWVANGLHSVRNDTKDTLMISPYVLSSNICVCIHCIQILHDLFAYLSALGITESFDFQQAESGCIPAKCKKVAAGHLWYAKLSDEPSPSSRITKRPCLHCRSCPHEAYSLSIPSWNWWPAAQGPRQGKVKNGSNLAFDGPVPALENKVDCCFHFPNLVEMWQTKK